ncbi:MAG TPA: RNA-binding protein [Chitinophagales bacterium]|nr:RNA-binding protein [Chitinophagales bacterium]
MNIYIANIPFKANEDDVRGIFESYGQVASVRIVLDKETQKSRGFGFVIMDNDKEASVAIDQLNGFEMMGKVLAVSEAKPKESRPEQGRRSFSGDRPQGDRPFRPQGDRPQTDRPRFGAGATDRPYTPRTNASDYNPAPPTFLGENAKPAIKSSKDKEFKKDKPDRAGDADKKFKKEAKSKKYNRFTDDEEETEWKFGKY